MSNTLYYSADPHIFEQFPGYKRGIVIAYDVINKPSSYELIEQLRHAENSVKQVLTMEKLGEHPRIHSWREAFRSMGAKPSEFRPSIEALVRRILKDQQIPTINALVDIGTIVSLKYLLPAGCHAIDVVTHDLSLCYAKGTENFMAFGSQEIEHPSKNEIIFIEDNTVLTRRWTWRQANHTLTQISTKAVEFNLDVMPCIPHQDLVFACQEIEQLITQHCGGRIRQGVLSQQNPTVQLSE